MSNVVDNKVVSMQFDNKRFESNVKTTMGTIDKLKSKLNFSGASKGLENLNSASQKVNFSGLSSGVETLKTKFSALQVMGVTALANITNSAVNAGKRIAESLTIKPVSDGFSEYELKMGSIQTIMASSHESLKTVKKYLEELNTYADKTIYSFSDMTTNIGKFTNAGVKLDSAVKAIQGISNEAALSGANANEASRAMYNFAQALSAGYVKLIDWKSIENANMATVEFKNELIKTGVALGTLKKQGNKYISTTKDMKGKVSDAFDATHLFNDSLSHQWMTSEVLTKTLEKYSDSTTDLGKRSFAAAQDIKTFTQLLDTLKEAAGSGWAETWELLFGDFNQAKKLWTSVSNVVGGFIDKTSKARNAVLKAALSSPLGQFTDKVLNFTKSANKAVDKAKDLSGVINKVVNGDYGNGQKRFDALTKAGYNWAEVQNGVNKKLGISYRYTTKLNNKKQESDSVTKTNIKTLLKMSDAQLKNNGFTNAEIKALRDLAEQSKKTGVPLEKLIKQMDQPSGRDLLIESFKNAFNGFVTVIKSVKNAWTDIFPPKDKAEQLYGLIKGFNELTKHLIVSDDKAKEIKRTFKGLFAIIQIITTITGGAFRFAFSLISKVLGAFDLDILSVTASIGDFLVKCRDWILKNGVITKGISLLANGIVALIKFVKKMVDAFMQIPQVQKAIDKFKSFFSNAGEIGSNFITGFINGIKDGSIVNSMIELGKKIINTIKSVLGIHSPSTVMYEVGGNVISGLVNGVKNGLSKISEVIKSVANKVIEVVGKIDWDKIFALGLSLGILASVKKVMDLIGAFSNLLNSFSNMFNGVSEVIRNSALVVKKFSKVLGALSFSIKAKAIKDLAISIGILVGAIILLTYFDTKKLWMSVGIVAALAGILVALAIATEKISNASVSIGKNGANVKGFGSSLMGVAASLLLLAMAVKIIAKLKPEQAQQGFYGLAGLILAISAVLMVYGTLVKGKGAQNMDKAGTLLKKMATTLLIMVIVVKLISKMSWGELAKGAVGILGLVAFIAAMLAITRLAGKRKLEEIGSMLIKMSIAMGIMTLVIKIISGMSWGELVKGAVGIVGFIAFIAAVVAITKIGKEDSIAKVGGLLLAMAGSMLIMAIVVKLIAGMKWGSLVKGMVGIIAFSAICIALIKAVKEIGSDAPKIAITLLAMSVAIGILAAIAVVLSMIDLGSLAKGVAAVGVLATVMSLMIRATKDASDCKGNIIAMTVAIGIMAGAVALLSFIDPSLLAGATAAMSILMLVFSLMIKVAGSAQSSIGSIIAMTVAVGLLAGILYLLSGLPIESTLSASLALSTLLLAMSAAMTIISKTGNLSIKAMASIAVMTLVVAGLAGILRLLAGLPIGAMLPSVLALSTLLLAMSAAMVIIGKLGTMSPMAMVSVAVMTLVVAGLAGILYLIAGLPSQSTLANVQALSTLLLAMSAACLILTVVGLGGPAALIGIGSLMAIIVGVGGLMAAIGALTSKFPQLEEFLDKGIPILEKIGHGLGSVLGNIIAGFSEAIFGTLPKLGLSLSQFMINATPFIVGMKMIDSSVIDGVSSLGKALLILTGAKLLDSLTSWLTGGSSLADFGKQLVPFGESMVKFSDSISGKIDSGAVVAAASAGKSLAEMAKNLPNSGGWLGKIFGENDVDDFGVKMEAFGKSMAKFSKAVAGKVDAKAVESAANAGKVVSEMASNLPNSGGWLGALAGENDMDDFANKMLAFGKGIVKFSKKVAGKVDVKAVESAANAGKVLTSLADSIPNSGGLVSLFTGDNAIDDFGGKLVTFAGSLVNFSDIVTGKVDGYNGVDEGAVTAAAAAGGALSALANSIPNSGGLISIFKGDNGIEEFGKNIVTFGKSLVDFSNVVVECKANSMSNAVETAKGLVEIAASVQDIDLDSIANFDVAPLGESIANFSTNVSSVKPEAMKAATDAGKALIWILSNLDECKPNLNDKFDVVPIGNKIKSFYDKISTVDPTKIDAAVTSAHRLKALINDLNALNADGVGVFVKAIKKISNIDMTKLSETLSNVPNNCKTVGTDMVKMLSSGMASNKDLPKKKITSIIIGMIKAVDDKKPSFKAAAISIMKEFDSGISTYQNKIVVIISKALDDAIITIKSYRSTFRNEGMNVAIGFANGIGSYAYLSELKSRAMAKKASEAAAKALKERSPSKVFYKIGAYGGQGFVNALDDYGKISYNAGSSMGIKAKNGIMNAMDNIRYIMDCDLDMEPTIRPILDLTDVESGANIVDDMFNRDFTMGGISNARAISVMMKNGNQNGTNKDVVAAINKLNKKLDNVGGTTNNINGVNYGDDSELTNAVKQIVRAARVERRK